MNLSATDLEQIVRTVMSQLVTASPVAERAPLAVSQQAGPAAGAATAPLPTSLRLDDRVVTQAVLEQTLAEHPHVRTLRLPAKAVITPSARDLLKKQALEVVRENSAHSPANAAASLAAAPWQVLISQAAPQALSALKSLRSAGLAWQQQLSGSAAEATRQGVGALCRCEAAGVIVLTGEPERVVCQANRQVRVRAAAVQDAAQWSTMQRTLGANFVALAPGTKSVYELQSLLRAILTAPPPAAPADWAE